MLQRDLGAELHAVGARGVGSWSCRMELLLQDRGEVPACALAMSDEAAACEQKQRREEFSELHFCL